MDKDIVMPKFGMTMEYGTIAEVYVKPGDVVKEGDKILDFETNKLTDTLLSPCAGTIKAVFCAPEDDVPVGEVVYTITC